MPAHLVGIAGRVNVGAGVVHGARQCLIEANQGDPIAYRAILQRVLTADPHGFAPAKSPYPAHDYAARDLYCAADKQSGLAVLASFPARNDHAPTLVTVVDEDSRSLRCDNEGVPAPGFPPRP